MIRRAFVTTAPEGAGRDVDVFIAEFVGLRQSDVDRGGVAGGGAGPVVASADVDRVAYGGPIGSVEFGDVTPHCDLDGGKG